jgi:hypothetical protein
MHAVRRAIHPLWFIGCPSEDVPGDWEAHCLEFDLFAQGQSLHEALVLCAEAAGIHISESLREQRDPYATRAPESFWSLRDSIVDAGEKLSPEQYNAIIHSRHSGESWVLVAELPIPVDIDFHIVDGQGGVDRPSLVWKKAA